MLPSNLLYQNKVNAAQSRAYTSNIQSLSSTYGPNDVIQLSIPCNPNTVLSGADSFLKFSMTVTNGGNANTFVRMAKAGAHSLIQRVRLFSPNGVLLEDVDNYNNLLAVLATHQRSVSKNTGVGSVVEGFDESVCLIQSAGAAPAPVSAMVNSVRGLRIVCPTYDSAVTLAANATTAPVTFAIPLVSIVGSLTQKYLPLFAMAGMGPMRLEIQLAPNAVIPFCCPVALSTFTISNIEYVGQFIELSDQAMATIRGSLGGGDLAMAVDRWANISYSATLGTSATSIAMPVPFKYSSITSLLLTQRLQSALAVGATDTDAFSSAHYNITEWFINLGSTTVPSKRPNDLSQMFSLYQQALGSPGDIGYVPNICRYQYSTAATVEVSGETPATTNPLTCLAPSFALGFDLSGYPSSDSSGLFSGFNSQTVDIYWNLLYAGQAAAVNIRYDAYCGHQAVITFGANGVQIRY